jgi:hypothetical protein
LPPAAGPYTVDLTLGITAYLLKVHSETVVEKVSDHPDTGAVCVHLSEGLHPAPVAVQIELAGSCEVQCDDGEIRTISRSLENKKPTQFLSCHKDWSVDRGMLTLASGFEHSACDPIGVYSISASNVNAATLLSAYDGGCAVLFTSSGFVANISTVTAGKKQRVNAYSWLSGVPEGVILFRRMNRFDEFIHHKKNIGIRCIAFARDGLQSFLNAEFHGDEGRAWINKAHAFRRDRRCMRTDLDAIADRLPDFAQLPAASSSQARSSQAQAMVFPRHALIPASAPRDAARSRSPRSNSRSPYRGQGVMIPPPSSYDIAGKASCYGTGKELLEQWATTSRAIRETSDKNQPIVEGAEKTQFDQEFRKLEGNAPISFLYCARIAESAGEREIITDALAASSSTERSIVPSAATAAMTFVVPTYEPPAPASGSSVQPALSTSSKELQKYPCDDCGADLSKGVRNVDYRSERIRAEGKRYYYSIKGCKRRSS